MARIFTIAAALALSACGTAASDEPTSAAGGRRVEVTTPLYAGGPLDGLTVTLELVRTTVPSGGRTRSTFTIENRTDQPITDPGCRFAAAAHDLIPADEPDAELSRAAVVDCAGPFTFTPGYRDRYTGPDFIAAHMVEGEPMPPGEYLAAVDIQGFSERLSVPVLVQD
jgi:hypothetical protein